jgi:hypothetical protein
MKSVLFTLQLIIYLNSLSKIRTRRQQCETNVFYIPYSDHSSNNELHEFVEKLRPKSLIPTVTDNKPDKAIIDLRSLFKYSNHEPIVNSHLQYREILQTCFPKNDLEEYIVIKNDEDEKIKIEFDEYDESLKINNSYDPLNENREIMISKETSSLQQNIKLNELFIQVNDFNPVFDETKPFDFQNSKDDKIITENQKQLNFIKKLARFRKNEDYLDLFFTRLKNFN